MRYEFNIATGEKRELPDEPARELTAQEIAQARRGQIVARLAEIDVQSVRALRAVTAASAKGKPVPAFDAGKLETLETEAAALRAELAAM